MSAIFFVFLLILSACASSLENPLRSQPTDSSSKAFRSQPLEREAKRLWNKRHQSESLRSFLSAQTAKLKSASRTDRDFVMMARAQYLYAHYFLVSDPARSKHFALAANSAEMALLENPEFARAAEGHGTLEPLSALKRRDAEALFWHAVALAEWAKLEGVSTSLKYQSQIHAMMDRVNALRPEYFHGAGHRFFGSYFGQLPGLNDADLRLSRKHFELALKKGPEFSGNHVSFAEIYGRKMDDSNLVRKHLELAARGKISGDSEFYSEQLLEQKRATHLLKGDAP